MNQHDGKKLHLAVKRSNIKVTDFFSLLGVSRGTMYNYFESPQLPEEVKEKAALLLRTNVNEIFGAEATTGTGNTEQRNGTAFAYVPIAKSAEYARQCNEALFINQLERIYIPGLPYYGEDYRYFEVEGDSMQPILSDRTQVLAQYIPLEAWENIYNYYIHVVVTVNHVMVKRLVQIDEDQFALVSDNEELYPQIRIDRSKIKELWLVKRKLDWHIPAPKVFQIKV